MKDITKITPVNRVNSIAVNNDSVLSVTLKLSAALLCLCMVSACGHKDASKADEANSQEATTPTTDLNDSQRQIDKMQREVVVTNPDEIIDSSAPSK